MYNVRMILDKLEQNWHEIERIGADAEMRGALIGARPSWATVVSERPKSDDANPISAALGAAIANRLKVLR